MQKLASDHGLDGEEFTSHFRIYLWNESQKKGEKKPETKSNFFLFHVSIARLFHQAFISFRKYVLEVTSLPADLHITISDICCGAGHTDDIYPYFMRYAKQIFPMLDCMDDLRKISDLRLPAYWFVFIHRENWSSCDSRLW